MWLVTYLSTSYIDITGMSTDGSIEYQIVHKVMQVSAARLSYYVSNVTHPEMVVDRS